MQMHATRLILTCDDDDDDERKAVSTSAQFTRN